MCLPDFILEVLLFHCHFYPMWVWKYTFTNGYYSVIYWNYIYRSTKGVQLNYLVRAPTVVPTALPNSCCFSTLAAATARTTCMSRRASPGSCGQRHSPWTSGAIPWHVLPVNPGRHEQKNTCTSGTIQQVPPFSHGLGIHTYGVDGR